MVGAITLRAAFAPDSISGKVYRESSAPTGAGGAAERTIQFLSDARYTYISLASFSSSTDSAASGRVVLRQPPPDGRYVYRKTGDASATIEFLPDSGFPPLPINLAFTGPGFGGESGDLPHFSFSFSDATSLAAAPVVNVALRGRVAEGRPLTAGFVVPGTSVQISTLVPPAGTAQREVLIRVVGGSSLRQFGIPDGWADPDFELYKGAARAGFSEYKYSDWNKITYGLGGFLVDPSPGVIAGLKRVFSFVGAFPLADDSKDAVGFVRLSPGAYTIIASAKTADVGGEVLIEVYFLP